MPKTRGAEHTRTKTNKINGPSPQTTSDRRARYSLVRLRNTCTTFIIHQGVWRAYFLLSFWCVAYAYGPQHMADNSHVEHTVLFRSALHTHTHTHAQTFYSGTIFASSLFVAGGIDPVVWHNFLTKRIQNTRSQGISCNKNAILTTI